MWGPFPDRGVGMVAGSEITTPGEWGSREGPNAMNLEPRDCAKCTAAARGLSMPGGEEDGSDVRGFAHGASLGLPITTVADSVPLSA